MQNDDYSCDRGAGYTAQCHIVFEPHDRRRSPVRSWTSHRQAGSPPRRGGAEKDQSRTLRLRAPAVYPETWRLCSDVGLNRRVVGRTPRSARVPLDPLFLWNQGPRGGLAGQGAGRGPGGPPHNCENYVALGYTSLRVRPPGKAAAANNGCPTMLRDTLQEFRRRPLVSR